MKKIIIGLYGGIIGAIVNTLFLLFAPGLGIEVYLSTIVTWIAIGILISICNLELNCILKGIGIALLVSSPSLVYTITSSLGGAMWTLFNTIMVGAFLGYIVDKAFIKLKG